MKFTLQQFKENKSNPPFAQKTRIVHMFLVIEEIL